MIRTTTSSWLVGLLGAALLLGGCASQEQKKSIEKTNEGVKAYNQKQYDVAIEKYNAALAVDPQFPSALYNQDRQLEAKGAAGYNPAEFRPGYTLVRIRDGAMELEYRVTGKEEKVSKRLPLRGA